MAEEILGMPLAVEGGGYVCLKSVHGSQTWRRGLFLQFEIEAPLVVALAWWRQSAGRFQLVEPAAVPSFFLVDPDKWVAAPWRSTPDGLLDPEEGYPLSLALVEYAKLGERLHQRALEKGAAPALAGLFLPAHATFVRWRWTISVPEADRFVKRRLREGELATDALLARAVDHFVQAYSRARGSASAHARVAS